MKENKINAKELAAAIALPEAVGASAAFLTRHGMEAFTRLRQPPLSPPGWVFAAAWTLLYGLMGTASYLVYREDVHAVRKRRALTLYAAQLAVNFIWTVIFFGLAARLAAFGVIVLLWLLIVACLICFVHIRKEAGTLLIPYALWVSFAAYLNLAAYMIN